MDCVGRSFVRGVREIWHTCYCAEFSVGFDAKKWNTNVQTNNDGIIVVQPLGCRSPLIGICIGRDAIADPNSFRPQKKDAETRSAQNKRNSNANQKPQQRKSNVPPAEDSPGDDSAS